jgi:hypothetical protein
MRGENIDEEQLIRVLEILVAAGKISRDDVLRAWQLAFFA